MLRPGRETDAGEEGPPAFLDGAGHPPRGEGREDDVVERRAAIEEVMLLEDKADAAIPEGRSLGRSARERVDTV